MKKSSKMVDFLRTALPSNPKKVSDEKFMAIVKEVDSKYKSALNSLAKFSNRLRNTQKSKTFGK